MSHSCFSNSHNAVVLAKCRAIPKRRWRNLISFWYALICQFYLHFRCFGLGNNFSYVIMLSAALDIIKRQEHVSTLVLLSAPFHPRASRHNNFSKVSKANYFCIFACDLNLGNHGFYSEIALFVNVSIWGQHNRLDPIRCLILCWAGGVVVSHLGGQREGSLCRRSLDLHADQLLLGLFPKKETNEGEGRI